jgi:hypothetical protein
VHGALVGKTRQPVGSGPQLGDCEVAEVCNDWSGLSDGMLDHRERLAPERPRMFDEHRADHLAAHECWDARRLLGVQAAHLAAQQAVIPRGAVVRARQPNPEAGIRRVAFEALGGGATCLHGRDSLQAVGRVVAVEHGHVKGVGRPAEVVCEQVVGLRLGAGDLHRVGELGLRAAAPALALRRALDEKEVQEAKDEGERKHEGDRSARPGFACVLTLAGKPAQQLVVRDDKPAEQSVAAGLQARKRTGRSGPVGQLRERGRGLDLDIEELALRPLPR